MKIASRSAARLAFVATLGACPTFSAAPTPDVSDERVSVTYIEPKGPRTGSESYLTICGPRNFQHVARYDGTRPAPVSLVDKVERSVVMLQFLPFAAEAPAETIYDRMKKIPPKTWGLVDYALAQPPAFREGRHWCSGVLVANNLVLTAGHCLSNKLFESRGLNLPQFEKNGANVVAAPSEIAGFLQARVRYQKARTTHGEETSFYFDVTKLLEFGPKEANGLDYALIEIATTNLNGIALTEKATAATLNPAFPAKDSLLAIVQHPDGELKQVDSGKLKALGTIERVPGDYLVYDDIDAFGGSSGAGVFDAEGRLVAIHTNGGCGEEGAEGNYGLSLKSIVERSRKLKQLTQG